MICGKKNFNKSSLSVLLSFMCIGKGLTQFHNPIETTNDLHSIVASISFPRMTSNINSDGCVDSVVRFKITFPASIEKLKRSCTWVARKKTQYRCTLPKVKDKCPVTCGKCIPPTTSPTNSPTPNPTSTPALTSPPTITASPTNMYDWCEDSDKQFSIESVVWITNKKNCKWVSQKSWFRCEIDEVVANCPRLCKKCECVNNKKRFEIKEGKNKKCAWVSKKDTEERCATYPAAVTNCPLSCGLCDKVFPSASPSASPTKALVASVKVTSKASVPLVNLVIPTDEKVLNALKDALKSLKKLE